MIYNSKIEFFLKLFILKNLLYYYANFYFFILFNYICPNFCGYNVVNSVILFK